MARVPPANLPCQALHAIRQIFCWRLSAIQRIEVTSSVEDAVAGADGLKANAHVPAPPFGTQFIAVCGAQADGEQRAEENGIGEVGAAPASAAAVQCIHLG